MITKSAKGKVIKNLYKSSTNHDWFLMETTSSTYELRLGGIKPTNEKRSDEFIINLNVKNKIISNIKTDDFAIYIELGSGECLIHSDTHIDNEGNTGFELKLVTAEEFKKERLDWYDADKELKEV